MRCLGFEGVARTCIGVVGEVSVCLASGRLCPGRNKWTDILLLENLKSF